MTRQTDLEEVVLEPTPTVAGRAVLRAATELYVKHLEGLAVKAQEVGRDADAARYQREADGFKAELLGEEDHQGRLQLPTVRLMPQHVKAIGKGLEFWLKNIRAAKGTVKALGKPELAEEFEEEATRVESALLPRFQDQQSLPLETPTSAPAAPSRPESPPAPPAKSLKQLAEEEAERAETEAKGVTPISRGRRGKRAAS